MQRAMRGARHRPSRLLIKLSALQPPLPPVAHTALSLMTRTAEPGVCPTFPRTRTAPTEARSAFAAHTGRIALSSLLSRIYVPPSRQAGRTLSAGPKTRTAIRRKRMPFRTAPKRQKRSVRSGGRTAIRHKIRPPPRRVLCAPRDVTAPEEAQSTVSTAIQDAR